MYGPCLEGARVTLAPPRLEYAEDYVRWFSDPAVTRYLERRTPLSRVQEEDYLRHKADDATTVLWAILAGERHIGSALIHEIDWRSRTGATSIVLGEREVWGEGYATEAIGLRSAYAFEELGLETLTTRSSRRTRGVGGRWRRQGTDKRGCCGGMCTWRERSTMCGWASCCARSGRPRRTPAKGRRRDGAPVGIRPGSAVAPSPVTV